MARSRSANLLVCVALGLPLGLRAGTIYDITDLGVLPGGSYSAATAIGSNGLVAGYGDDGSGNTNPFLWSAASGLFELTIDSVLAESFGVNASGTAVGYQLNGDFTMSAFLANAAGSTTIPTLGGSNNAATAINDGGTVVGYSDTAGGSQLAFRYSGGASSTSLGVLPGGSNSAAYAINQSGAIAGAADDSNGAFHAVVYTGGAWIDLGIPNGYVSSAAAAISNSGLVAGTLADPYGATMGFLWSPSDPGVMTLLGALTPGGDSQAYGVNSSGVVVGSADGVALLYDGSGIYDLNTLLGASSTGWKLEAATAIDDAGQIVGYGEYNGAAHGFLLDPESTPEPSSALLVVAGLFLTASWRRRASGPPPKEDV